MSVSWVGVVGIVTVGFDVVGRDRDISGDLSGSSRLGYHYAYLTLPYLTLITYLLAVKRC